MKERLLEFLRSENKSSAQLADEIGVQPSSISHILSGRNNPSLDFVLKMFDKYQFLSTEWLLFGRGSMYKEVKMNTLFDDKDTGIPDSNSLPLYHDNIKSQVEPGNLVAGKAATGNENKTVSKGISVRKIVWFFDNNSFEEYYPNS